jgi:hypothetical protein
MKKLKKAVINACNQYLDVLEYYHDRKDMRGCRPTEKRCHGRRGRGIRIERVYSPYRRKEIYSWQKIA